MKINEFYKLDADESNVIIQRRKLKEDKTYTEYKNIAYVSTVKDAFHYIVEKEIKATELKSLELICEKIEELHSVINKLNVG